MNNQQPEAISQSPPPAQNAKSHGVTYTPPTLARFVAQRMVAAWSPRPDTTEISVLDPAAGDGELLIALVETIRERYPQYPIIAEGFETDPLALQVAHDRLAYRHAGVTVALSNTDFLKQPRGGSRRHKTHPPLDFLIANPPYVRTQRMGTNKAQSLAKKFGLAGRVDLYYAFVLAMAAFIVDRTVAGIIVSNRFMKIDSGAQIRQALLEKLHILSVWDFGDTKLFDAAVLPAVLLAKAKTAPSCNSQIPFTSLYETTITPESRASDPIHATQHDGVVQIDDGRRFVVTRGNLTTDGSQDGIWRVSNESTERWLDTAHDNTWGHFNDIGKIRVGVKTCADKTFIRSDWHELYPTTPPELLKPILTHHSARRFKAENREPSKSILYTHEISNGLRKAVDLADYPVSAAYLEKHREDLEARHYVTDAGRQWFEIWVPQNPSDWPRPKLVFRDISDKPTFWIDQQGYVVNGDCYWLTPSPGVQSDLLWLALAVANSTFIEKFYDLRFRNQLYGGRRRFMTQYVRQFPIPDPSNDLSRIIIANAKQIYDSVGTPQGGILEQDLDRLVWEAFGLPFEEPGR